MSQHPCLDCDKRYKSCHLTCQDYLKYKIKKYCLNKMYGNSFNIILSETNQFHKGKLHKIKKYYK